MNNLPTGFRNVDPTVLALIKCLYDEGEFIDFNPDANVKTTSQRQYRVRAGCWTVRFCSLKNIQAAHRNGLIKKDRFGLYRITVYGIVAAKTGFSFVGYARGLTEAEIAAVAYRLLSAANPRVYAAKLVEHARHLRISPRNGKSLDETDLRLANGRIVHPTSAPGHNALVQSQPRRVARGPAYSELSVLLESLEQD